MRITKHLCYALILAFGLCACNQPSADQSQPAQSAAQTAANNRSVEQAYAAKLSNVQVSGSGVVVKLLTDDNKGAKHQKFLVKINPQQTLLFAHNIDLAPRVPVQAGDTISFSGEYVYNPKGGVIHWTHHSPNGNHPGGWIMFNNEKYQ
nr:DUF3465 domain-containing protein [uncultured Methylotenera sp.]